MGRRLQLEIFDRSDGAPAAEVQAQTPVPAVPNRTSCRQHLLRGIVLAVAPASAAGGQLHVQAEGRASADALSIVPRAGQDNPVWIAGVAVLAADSSHRPLEEVVRSLHGLQREGGPESTRAGGGRHGNANVEARRPILAGSTSIQ